MVVCVLCKGTGLNLALPTQEEQDALDAEAMRRAKDAPSITGTQGEYGPVPYELDMTHWRLGIKCAVSAQYSSVLVFLMFYGSGRTDDFADYMPPDLYEA